MINVGHIETEIPKHFVVPNMLLLAGSGQNVGKTSFAVEAIKYLKKLGNVVYGLKITPHFHTSNPTHLIVQTDDYQIALEKDFLGNKDSSRMLKAGADEVFFVQTTTDNALLDVFDFVNRMAKENVLWVCESGGLRFFVDPGVFLYFKHKNQESQKESAKKLMPLANRIVEFDGSSFDLPVNQISVSENKLILD